MTSGLGKGGRFPQVALFDLDGTLLDSAPDMVATANRMLAARGLGQVDADALRKHVSKGARAMVSFVFAEAEGEAHAALLAEFLEVYQQELGRHSRLFDGIAAMLEALEAAGSRWGIITNKAEYLARDVVAGLGWQERCAVLVGGDTYAERKPHPLPLLEAARTLGVDPSDCVYVGDDERDVLAAKGAGMPSIAVLWGYRLDGDDPLTWQADRVAARPHELVEPTAWPRR